LIDPERTSALDGPGAEFEGTAIDPGVTHESATADDRVEFVVAFILALATVIAAWSAYQATRWSGEQARHSSLAAARRTEASQETSLFAAERLIDVQMWLTWFRSKRTGVDDDVAASIEERFRSEFKPAFDAWLGQVPEGQIPPRTPFEMEVYRSATGSRIIGLEDEADALFADAQRANQLADDFVLVTVIMAGVLFLAGVGARFRAPRLRLAMLAIAVVLLTGGLAFMASMPQSVAI
jgi:hypothetical protein